MKKQIIGLLAVALLAGAGCSKKLADTGSYFHSGSEYLNSEGDGSITVRAYGMGKTREDAIEQACKNAVRDVLFKGVQTPENTILSRPLIREINAEEKYQYFFNPFVADGGAYRRFVSMEDRRPKSDGVQANSVQQRYAVTVRVLRSELRQYLVEHHIVKP